MFPTPADCHKDNCSDNDQQFSRIVRRWASDPLGQFGDRESNYQRLRVAVEFFICPVLKLSADATLHEYWCDGVDFVAWDSTDDNYNLGGACIISDRHCNTMWLAPFELDICYDQSLIDCPASVVLRLGHRDPEYLFSRKYPAGRQHRLFAMTHFLYGGRPTVDAGWAAHIVLDPYRD
jgi:hypothetical protein